MPAPTSSLKTLLWASASIRVLLICWGEIQDRTLAVKYTDIDYVVFTDAARFVAGGGSPFDRSTYRYSPLLAYLLLPNIVVHGAWGKLLFSAGDMLAALLISRLLRRLRTPEPSITLAAAAWLCNPFTFTISTRGSCDVVAVVLLLALLQLLLSGRTLWAAAVYGLVVHLRIYPIIFAPALVFFLAKRALTMQQQDEQTLAAKRAAPQRDELAQAHDKQPRSLDPSMRQLGARPTSRPSLWAHPPSACVKQILLQGATFGGASAAVFLLLGCLFYTLYGHQFLQEAFLHHVTRKDPRHNFSPLFYPLYLEGSGHQIDSTLHESPSDSLIHALAHASEGQLAGLSKEHVSQLARSDRLGVGSCGQAFCDAHNSSLPQSGEGVAAQAAAAAHWIPNAAAWASCFQLLLQLVLAAALHCDLPACLLLQTMAFVALNKVCTAQYFVWYFSLVPLLVPRLTWPPPRGLALALAAWVVSQLHWLLWGYLLEFQGLPVHLPLWCASIAFLGSNTVLMVQIIRCLDPVNRPKGLGFLEVSTMTEIGKQKTH